MIQLIINGTDYTNYIEFQSPKESLSQVQSSEVYTNAQGLEKPDISGSHDELTYTLKCLSPELIESLGELTVKNNFSCQINGGEPAQFSLEEFSKRIMLKTPDLELWTASITLQSIYYGGDT